MILFIPHLWITQQHELQERLSMTDQIHFNFDFNLYKNPQGFLMSTIHLIQIMQDKNNEISFQYLPLPSRWVTILSDKPLNGHIPLEMFEIKEVMTTKQS